jgi:hypothetical protein
LLLAACCLLLAACCLLLAACCCLLLLAACCLLLAACCVRTSYYTPAANPALCAAFCLNGFPIANHWNCNLPFELNQMDLINCRKFSQEKRERWAWYMYDWANSVYVNTGVQMFMPILMSNLFGQDFFGYWVSFSVFMQCIVFISCSALADFGQQRKRLLAFFSISGSLSTCLFWFVKSPNDKDLAVFLLVVSNVSFGASFVMYNAYLSPIAAGLST